MQCTVYGMLCAACGVPTYLTVLSTKAGSNRTREELKRTVAIPSNWSKEERRVEKSRNGRRRIVYGSK